MINILRKAVLRLIQWIRIIHLWVLRRLKLLDLFIRKVLIDEDKSELKKKPKCPAISSENESDIITFIVECFELGCDHIVVHRPSGFTIGSLQVDLYKLGFYLTQHLVSTNSKLVYTKDDRKVVIDMLADRQSYVQAIQDKIVGPSTPTSALPKELETPNVDLLIVCGTDTVGDFPPLALRACEIFFAESPLALLEIYWILRKFARTEQRFGV